MQTRLNPYLTFQDNARQAIEFYQSIFGGTLQTSTFKEFNMSQDPSQDNLLMHANLEAESGIVLMAADTPPGMEYRPGTNISISLSGDQEAELAGYFQKLAAGGQVIEPLVKAPWGDTFGMCVDPYGIRWMVNISGQPAA
jgi:PhnB protein